MLLPVLVASALLCSSSSSAQLQPQSQLLQLVQDLQKQLAQQQRLLEEQQRLLQAQLLSPQSRVIDVSTSPAQQLDPAPPPSPPPAPATAPAEQPQPQPLQQPSRQRPSRPSRPRPQAQRPNQTESSKPQFLEPGVGRWLLSQDQACLPCICEAASGCDETLGCDDRGFCGPFLLSKRYWELAGRPLLRGDSADRPGADVDCLRDSFCAAEAVRGYLDRFAQDCDGNRRVDCLDLARVHFQGPFNCRAPLRPPSDFSETFRRCWDASRRTSRR